MNTGNESLEVEVQEADSESGQNSKISWIEIALMVATFLIVLFILFFGDSMLGTVQGTLAPGPYDKLGVFTAPHLLFV